MHLRYLLLLLSLTLLSACEEEHLLLRFDTPVSGFLGIDVEYKQAILRGLDEAGVDSSQASLSIQEGGLVVAVSLPDSALDQAGQQSLSRYFDQQVSDRANAEKVRLHIHTEAPTSPEGAAYADVRQMLHDKASKMRPLFTSRVEYVDGPELTYQDRNQKSLPFAQQTSTAFCQLTVGLEKPLPQIDLVLSIPGSPLNAFLGLQSFRLPSSLSIGDSDLDKGVAEKRYEYRLTSSGNAERADILVFTFGDLGQVQHMNGTVSGSLDDLEAACLARVASAGRPFTFHHGHTLDRLVAVEYRFADASMAQ